MENTSSAVETIFNNMLPSSPSYFAGREDTTTGILHRINTAKLIYVFGEAGIGKSTFLSHLIKTKFAEKKISFLRVQKGDNLTVLLTSLLKTSKKEWAELFEEFNSKFLNSDNLIFIDDSHNLPTEDEKIFFRFITEYFQGKSIIFVSSRKLPEKIAFERSSEIYDIKLEPLHEKDLIKILKAIKPAQKTLKAEEQKTIIETSKGNPFLLHQLALLDEIAEKDIASLHKIVVEKITSDLSPEEIVFIKFYALLNHDLTISQLEKYSAEKKFLNHLVLKNILEITGSNRCHLSDLLKFSLNKIIENEERTTILKEIVTFLKNHHENFVDLFILSKICLSLMDTDEANILIEDYLDLWFFNDLNTEEIILLLKDLIKKLPKNRVSAKILNALVRCYLKHDNYSEIIVLLKEFNQEKGFTPMLNWFYGVALLESGNFSLLLPVIEVLKKEELKFQIRGEILNARYLLRISSIPDAISAFQKITVLPSLNENGDNFSQELKIIYNNLAEAFEEQNNFPSAFVYQQKAEAILRKSEKQSNYNLLLNRINFLHLKINLEPLTKEILADFQKLEEDLKKYFYYDFNNVYTQLKSEILICQGKLKIATTFYNDFCKKLPADFHLAHKELQQNVFNYCLFSINLENFNVLNNELEKLCNSNDLLIKNRAIQLKKISFYLLNKIIKWEPSDELNPIYLLNIFPDLSFSNPTNWYKLLSEKDHEKAFYELEKELNETTLENFSFEKLHLLYLTILLALKGHDNKKFKFYLSFFSTMISSTDLLPPKWQTILNVFNLIDEGKKDSLASLKKNLFDINVPIYLKPLIIYLFQINPTYILIESLNKLPLNIFKLSEPFKNLLDLHLDCMQFNIRRDFKLTVNRKNQLHDIYSLTTILVTKRGIIINLIDRTIQDVNGNVVITESKQNLLFEFFKYLVEKHQDFPGKEELITAVWKKKYYPEADDPVIYSNLKRLREIFKDENKEIFLVQDQCFGISEKTLVYTIQYSI